MKNFKKVAAERYVRGAKLTDLAVELEVTVRTLRNWVKAYRAIPTLEPEPEPEPIMPSLPTRTRPARLAPQPASEYHTYSPPPMPGATPTPTTTANFWLNVEQLEDDEESDFEGGCWQWLGKLSPYEDALTTHKGIEIPAARMSYVLKNNTPLLPTQELQNRCGNRSCVNPAHYELIDV